MTAKKGWTGVDLDGTIAHYDGWKGETHIGAPIAKMVARVKQWLAEGKEVRIFTARMSDPDPDCREAVALAIGAWTKLHVGQPLPATCVKDFDLIELYDDRAVTVEMNTGRLLAPSSRDPNQE